MHPERVSAAAGDPLGGTKSLAEIDATSDAGIRLLWSVSLLEILVRDFILEAGLEPSKSLQRMVEALFYSGRHPSSASFRALEFSLNVRNALLHPNSSLRQTAPVAEHEIAFACFVVASAIRELADPLPPEIARRIRGDPHGDRPPSP